MGMPRAGNRSIVVMPVDVAAARIQRPMPIQKPVARRSACLSRAQQFAWPYAHVWRISRHRVHLAQKKVAQLPPLHTTLLAPDPEDPTSTTLELDELWSFVLKKAHDSWIWIAL
jgi:hypothetical protein